MPFCLKITGEAADALITDLVTLTSFFASVGPRPVHFAEEPGAEMKQARPAKGKKQEAAPEAPVGESAPSADPKEEAAPSAGSADTPTDTTSDPESSVTYEDVRKAVLALSAAKGRDTTVDVLGAFGVDHASKLTKDQWPQALAKLQGAM